MGRKGGCNDAGGESAARWGYSVTEEKDLGMMAIKVTVIGVTTLERVSGLNSAA